MTAAQNNSKMAAEEQAAKQAINKENNMAAKIENKEKEVKQNVAYKLVPPEGGWGYMIVVALTVVMACTSAPICGFGIFYSDFLKSVGDETTGTTLANAMFNTISSFTGLATNCLLKKFSYRKVGLLGAAFYSAGAFGIIFAQTMIQFIIFFGFIQGLGFGLLFPAVCTAFNCYFDKRLNLMMSVSQAVMAACNMGFPPLAAAMMSYLGFRGTITAVAFMSLLIFPATATLQPIKWHWKEEPVSTEETVISIEAARDELEDKIQKEPLMPRMSLNNELCDRAVANKLLDNVVVYEYERRTSIVSVGERAVSVTAEDFDHEKDLRKDEKKSVWQSLSSFMDLSLLKDWRYLNIAMGLSLSYIGDVAFISLIPLLLSNSGFKRDDIAFTMMCFFGLDLVGRVSLTFTSSFCKKITNRQLFLGGTLLSAFLRLAFVANDAYMWKFATLCGLGLLRSHIQTPFSLVISENYPTDFATAFSLLMVMVGCVSLLVGPLLSIIKHLTGSDVMTCHVLTVAFVICSVSWLVEPLFSPKKKRDGGK